MINSSGMVPVLMKLKVLLSALMIAKIEKYNCRISNIALKVKVGNEDVLKVNALCFTSPMTAKSIAHRKTLRNAMV
jgi:hypothetical protein